MSCNYADGLSKYDNKGICGVPEQHDPEEEVNEKVAALAEFVRNSKHFVVHTGAGISTSAGIPDFRGPQGVWTLEERGEKRVRDLTDFKQALPTFTHRALLALSRSGHMKFLISQNVDGLHLRSGHPAERLAELHGNVFLDQCTLCHRLIVRSSPSETVGEKLTGRACPLTKAKGQACRGKLRDTVLDWEAELPKKDLNAADRHSRVSDLSLCLGSTLQINPSGNLPLLTKKNGGKFVIVNLQPTKHDSWADLIIRDYVDNIMRKLLKHLEVEAKDYEPKNDPVLCAGLSIVEFNRAQSSPKRTSDKKTSKQIRHEDHLESSQESHRKHTAEKKPKLEGTSKCEEIL